MAHNTMRILFVCLGNICRSPLAEVIVKAAAAQRGLDQYHFESAGTGNWHIGGSADPRSAAKAAEYGLDLSTHKAQQVTPMNCHNWDWFVAMDSENRRELINMGVPESRLLMMRQFENSKAPPNVPDPYYGGSDGFEHAYQMLASNAEHLLDFLENQH